MPFSEPDELPRRHSRDELLARIYRDGHRRRRRRAFAGVGAGAAVLTVIAAAVLVARLPGGEPQQVATRGPATTVAPGAPPTTMAHPPTTIPTTTAATDRVPTTASRPTTTASVTTRSLATTAPVATTAPETTTTAPQQPCRDGTDSGCGPFRWDPEPEPNAPLTIEVTPRARPADARTVDFHVDYSDPDARIDEGCRNVSFGDGTSESVSGGLATCVQLACAARYGPTTPPAREPGHAAATVTHTFANPGMYEVRFTARSGFGCYQPYGNSADETVVVVIQ